MDLSKGTVIILSIPNAYTKDISVLKIHTPLCVLTFDIWRGVDSSWEVLKGGESEKGKNLYLRYLPSRPGSITYWLTSHVTTLNLSFLFY